MLLRYLKVGAFLLMALMTTAQDSQKYIDSLFQSFIGLHPEDIVDTLNKLSKANVASNAQKGFMLAEKAFEEATRIDYHKGRAIALSNIGYAHLFMGRYDDALLDYQRSYDIYTDIEEEEGKANILFSLGQAYYYKSDFHHALEYYNQALAIYQDLGDTHGIAKALYDIGYIYYDRGKFDLAFEKFQQGLRTTQEKAQYDNINNSLYNGIGHVLNVLGKYEESIKYYTKSLELNRNLNDQHGIAHSINNIGNCYFYWGKYNESLTYYDSALVIFNKAGNKLGATVALHNLGLSCEALEEYDKALDYLGRDLELSEEIGHPAGVAESLNDIGELYVKIGKLDKGEECINKSLQMAHQLQLQDLIYENYFALSDIHLKKGQDAEALVTYKKYVDYRDSVLSYETHEKVFTLQAEYEKQKIVEQMMLLEKENELNMLRVHQSRYLIVGMIIIVAFLLLSLLYLYRVYKLKAERQMLVLEQKLLRSQMSPHFIFNSLINIQGFILTNDPENANKYITNFARLIRNILEYSRHEYVSIEEELITIENYLELQNLRFANKFDYSIEVDEAVDKDRISIPPMLAQPFIENSIEHGIKPKMEKGHITIRIRLNDNMLQLEIEDDGIGREKAEQIEMKKNMNHKSLATSITRERLEAMNKKLKHKIQLNICDLKDEVNEVIGTRVVFNIPYRNKE